MIVLGSNLTAYSLNETAEISMLEVENFSIHYEKNKIYYMGILNDGENSLNLFNIKVEEEISKPQGSSVILFLFGYILIIFSAYSYRRHKKIWRDEKTPPPDILRKEAAYADRIKNVEIELEVYQNTLKNLEDLNLKGDISINLYQTKKNHYEDNIHKLNNEKQTTILEIENVLKKFKRE